MNSITSNKIQSPHYATLMVLITSVFVFIQCAVAGSGQTPRDSLLQEIRSYANRHVSTHSPMNTQLVLDIFKNNDLRLQSHDIALAYEEEYMRLKKAESNDQLHLLTRSLGWIAAGLLLLILVLRDQLRKVISKILETITRTLYEKFSGFRLFRLIALKHYENSLRGKYEKLHVPFRPHRPLNMRDVYVPLRIVGSIDRLHLDEEDVLSKSRRLMIVGTPGSGKSMLIKHIAFSYSQQDSFIRSLKSVPIIVELHRLNDPSMNFLKVLSEEMVRNHFPKPHHFIDQNLRTGNLLLLFDGLDEVSPRERTRVTLELKDFLEEYKRCRAIITCRSAVYKGEFDSVVENTFEISEFDDQQIYLFLNSWRSEIPPHKSIEQLISTLRDRPRIMLLARNPLLLTIIAYLYADTEFILPYSRAEFYEKATGFILEQWHQERNLYRANDKKAILRHLALVNQTNTADLSQDRRTLGYLLVIDEVKKVLPSINLNPLVDTKPILDEIVERSGLLLAIDGGEKYQFAHLTVQEFFCAEILIGDFETLIDYFEADPNSWREVVKLWCGLAADCTNLVDAVYKIDPVTAFECIADSRKLEQGLANRMIHSFKMKLGDKERADEIEKAFGAVASSLYGRGKDVFEYLVQLLTPSNVTAKEIAAANALSYSNLPSAAIAIGAYYSESPEITNSLKRMGDIALPVLSSKACEGLTSAVLDIMDIGTTSAVEYLVPLLWHDNQQLSQTTAWCLATMVSRSEIEKAIENVRVPIERFKEPYIDWIWSPFIRKKDSQISIIMGRISYLLIRSIRNNYIPLSDDIDVRLSVPLCSIECEDVLHIVNPTKFEETDVLQTLANRALSPRRLDHSLSRHGKYLEVLETLAKTEFDRGSDLKEIFGKEYLKCHKVSSSFMNLFNRIPIRERMRLLLNLSKGVLPRRQDWTNIFTDVNSKTGLNFGVFYCFTLFLTLASSSIVFMVETMVRAINFLSPFQLETIAMLLALFLLSAGSLMYMIAITELLSRVYTSTVSLTTSDWLSIAIKSSFALLRLPRNLGFLSRRTFLERPLLGGITIVTETLVGLFSNPAPLGLYFLSKSLLSVFPWFLVPAIWIALSIAIAIFFHVEQKNERVASNPFRGIIWNVQVAKDKVGRFPPRFVCILYDQ